MGASNGISQTNAQYVSWGTGVYDFDNDGNSDILIFHGGLIHLIPQEHTLFRGLGNGQVRRCFRAGRRRAERTHRGPRCVLCRLRQRRQSRCVSRESRRDGHAAPQCFRRIRATGLRSSSWAQKAIAMALARALKLQPAASAGRQNVWRAPVSLAGRRALALRSRRGAAVDKIIIHWPERARTDR